MACLVCGKDEPGALCLECEKLARNDKAILARSEEEKREPPYHEKDGVPCEHDLVNPCPSPFSMFE